MNKFPEACQQVIDKMPAPRAYNATNSLDFFEREAIWGLEERKVCDSGERVEGSPETA